MNILKFSNFIVLGSMLLVGCGSGTDVPNLNDTDSVVPVNSADGSTPSIGEAQAGLPDGDLSNSSSIQTSFVDGNSPIVSASSILGSTAVTAEPQAAIETTEEPQVTTIAEVVTEEPQVTTAAEVATEKPQVTTAAEVATEQAQVSTAAEVATEQAQVSTAAEVATEQPQVSTAAEVATEQPQVTTAAEVATEQPQVTTAAEVATEQPQVTTAAEVATVAPVAAGGATELPTIEPLLVFPGAEGFGTKSIAGRGGEICKVTTLANEGPGTLRSCVERSGPRTVLFDVGGTIEVDRAIRINDPFISIYGQSAPGDGIMLRGSLDSIEPPLSIRSHDVLIQHMRIRAGTSREITCCRDAVAIGSSTSGEVYNIVLDHNSFAWGADEIVDIWYDSHDITLSYNIIAESLHDAGTNNDGPAGRGLVIGSNGAHSISVHHNLIAHSYQRNPLVKTSGIVDITNNLIFHYTSRAGQQHDLYNGQKVNWVKNNYIPLLNQSSTVQDSKTSWGDLLLTDENGSTQMFLQDNLGFNRSSNDDPQTLFVNTNWDEPYDTSLGYHKDQRFPAPAVTEVDATSLEATLITQVGATLPLRDAVDTRILSDLEQRGGKMPNCVAQDDRPGEARCDNNVGGWPTLSGGAISLDSDNDGIPDSWEINHGLNPNSNDSNGDSNNDGYTDLEHWIYSLTN